MPAKAKITDVARAAGVSVTTVSHTLSGRRPVGEEVRGRVLRAIRELNYRPNYFAGAMKQNRTGLVGILVDQCRNAATGILLEGMEQELGSRGYEIVLGIAGLDRAKGTRLLEKFASGMVDGVINMLPQLSSDEAELIAPSLPLVTHLRQASAPVYIDYEEGARQAFEYLRGLGHRRIGCISSRRRRMNAADPVLDGCRPPSGKLPIRLCSPTATTPSTAAAAPPRSCLNRESPRFSPPTTRWPSAPTSAPMRWGCGFRSSSP